MDNPTVKADLRRQLIAARRAMSADVKAQSDARIMAALWSWIDEHQPRSLGGYLAMAGEPELMPLYESLSSRGITLAMPVAVEKHTALVYQRWLPGQEMPD